MENDQFRVLMDISMVQASNIRLQNGSLVKQKYELMELELNQILN